MDPPAVCCSIRCPRCMHPLLQASSGGDRGCCPLPALCCIPLLLLKLLQLGLH